MRPRTRFTFWVAAVGGCAFSPVLWHAIAPWAGAAWQCLCLMAIGWLYATTPADAIRLNPWVSKALILAGTVAWPALCYGRVTWVMAVVVGGLLLLDLMHIEPEQPWDGKGKRPMRFRVRWSWRPGFLADWLAPQMLWFPGLWPFFTQHELIAVIPVAMPVALWAFVVQATFHFYPRPWPFSSRTAGFATLLLISSMTVAGFALSADMAR